MNITHKAAEYACTPSQTISVTTWFANVWKPMVVTPPPSIRAEGRTRDKDTARELTLLALLFGWKVQRKQISPVKGGMQRADPAAWPGKGSSIFFQTFHFAHKSRAGSFLYYMPARGNAVSM